MSSTEFSTTRCACCDEVGHSTRRCPELKPPALDFDKGQRIPDDEGDDCSKTNHGSVKQKAQVINIYITPLKNQRAKKRARINSPN